MTQTLPLDKRIALALTEQITTAAAVQDLIVEVETAIVTADKAAKEAEQRALDPAVLDPNAEQTMRDTDRLARRLNAALPKLMDCLAALLSVEYNEAWLRRYNECKLSRDGLATELQIYPEMVAKLVDLFRRVATNDDQINRLHADRPANVSAHLLGAEATARGLQGGFTTSQPSVLKSVQLPDWTDSSKMLFPPATPSLAVAFAQSMVMAQESSDLRATSDHWWISAQEDNDRRAALAARHEAEEAEQQAASRREYEDSLWRTNR